MDYYNLCSSYYGDSFKNTFSNIMNIKTYTLLVVILFVLEIIYHAIIVFVVVKRIDFNNLIIIYKKNKIIYIIFINKFLILI